MTRTIKHEGVHKELASVLDSSHGSRYAYDIPTDEEDISILQRRKIIRTRRKRTHNSNSKSVKD